MLEQLTHILPGFNASMNGVAFLCLAGGFVAIRSGKEDLHRKLMLGAVVVSAIFLAGYLTRMGLTGTHRFPDAGWVRTLYLGILIPHSILAALNLPLILRALYLAWRKRFPEHRRVVRFAWPIWMFVSATGVIVYWMLYHLAPRLTT